ncbi:MAG: hypothetical protein GXO73_04810, partial [Calditrichaeota bacterium]|nr:hypothetical protein [Calditrichota bacterium]
MQEAGFQLATRISPGGLHVELRVPSAQIFPQSIDGNDFTLVKFGPEGVEQAPTGEAVPVLLLPVVAPTTARVTIELESATWRHINVDRIVPFAVLQGIPDSVAVESFKRNNQPAAFWDLGFAEEARFRGHRILRVRIPLLRPDARGYKRLDHVSFWIRGLVPERGLATETSALREALPSEVENLVLIPSSVAESAIPPALPKPVQPGKIKILLSDSGFYRVTGQDLADAGVSLAEIDPATLQLSNRGHQIPFFLRGPSGTSLQPTDTLFFYAPALHGDTCFVYPFSDTNVVWLDWGGPGGARFKEQPVSPGEELLADTTFVYR